MEKELVYVPQINAGGLIKPYILTKYHTFFFNGEEEVCSIYYILVWKNKLYTCEVVGETDELHETLVSLLGLNEYAIKSIFNPDNNEERTPFLHVKEVVTAPEDLFWE